MSPAVRLVLLALAGALILPAPAAQAKSGPCLPDYPHGTQCKVWNGKVRYVDDGDTLDADVPGDGLGGLLRVRIIGAQAMEQTSYRAAQRAGDCHAVDATNRLEQLVRKSKKRIRVTSLYPESRSRGRRLRSVAVRRGGRWRDVGRILISEGHALWWPGRRRGRRQRPLQRPDPAGGSRRPRALQPQRLRHRAERGPPDRTATRSGTPTAATATTSTASGSGSATTTPSTRCRSTAGTCATPACAASRSRPARRSPPNSSVTVYAGQGENFGNEYFWNLTAPVFENTTRDDRAIGDGAYLFDPQGDLRAWMMYPCRVNCANPAQGRISLDTQPRKDEYISLHEHRRHAARPRDVPCSRPRRTRTRSRRGRRSASGQTIRVHTEGDPEENTELDKYWGMTGQILNNSGDTARLSTYTDVPLACTAYGSKSC